MQFRLIQQNPAWLTSFPLALLSLPLFLLSARGHQGFVFQPTLVTAGQPIYVFNTFWAIIDLSPYLLYSTLLYSRGIRGASSLPSAPQLLPPSPPASPKLRCRTHRFRGKEKYFPWLLWRDKLAAAAAAARGENGGALPGQGRREGGRERREKKRMMDSKTICRARPFAPVRRQTDRPTATTAKAMAAATDKVAPKGPCSGGERLNEEALLLCLRLVG